jgi:hypothetical protein
MCQCITAHYPIGVQPLHKFSYFGFALLEIFTYSILHGRLHVGDSGSCTIKWFVHFGKFVDVVIVLVLDDFSSGSASNCFFERLGEVLH